MKQRSLFLFILLLFAQKLAAQSLLFQDTIFTAPVLLTGFPDGVSFERCRFAGITADAALTLLDVRYVTLTDCIFEDIQGTAVLVDGTQGSELFSMFHDTLRNVQGAGVVIRKAGRVDIYDCQLASISGQAIDLSSVHRVEVVRDQLSDVGGGITCFGSGRVDSLHIFRTSIRRVHGAAGEPQSGNGIRIANTGLAIIDRCSVDSCLAAGIHVGQGNNDSLAVDSVAIRHSIISRTNLDGLLGEENVRHAHIHDNEISYAGFLGGRPGAGDHGIRWQGPDCRIEDNNVHHATDTACAQAYCGAGISVGNSGLVARNLVHDCTGNGMEYKDGLATGPPDLRIFNNIVYDVAGNPVMIHGGDSLHSEPARILIRNNTLLGVFRGDSLRNSPLAVSFFANEVSAQGNLLLFENMADTSQFVQVEGAGAFIENLNLKVTSDTGFADYAGRDLHLSATSPARNFLPPNFGEPNDDIDREPRDPRHDAGADELASLLPGYCGCVNCPSFMPDNFMGSFFFYVSAAAQNDLADSTQGVCGVRLYFDHEYLSDLTMNLISPAGQAVSLIGPTGFFGPTDATSWDLLFLPCADPASPDPGFTAVWNNNQAWGIGGNYTGTYHPSAGCLENFNTGPVSGLWRLEVTDGQAVDVGTLYDFEVLFCNTTGVECRPCLAPPAINLLTNVGDWNVQLVNNSTEAVTYQLDFGDSTFFSGITLPLDHSYADTGSYLLRLIATNDCGNDTLEQVIHIAGSLPTANVAAEPSSACPPAQIQINVSAANHVDTWHWLLPGAIPGESFEAEPTVVYNEPGIYPATLIITNVVGADTLYYPSFVEVRPDLLTPGFTVQVQGDSIIATNTTQNFSTFFWLLNGELVPGNVFPEQQVYVVDSSGNYLITLYVANSCDVRIIEQTVPVILSGLQNAGQEMFALSLLPNPNDGRCRLEIVSPENLPADLVVLNTAGQTVLVQKIDIHSGNNTRDLDLSRLPPGVYLLRLQTGTGSQTISFILQK